MRGRQKGEAVANPRAVVGAITVGGIEFELRGGLLTTWAELERRSVAELRRAYAALTEDPGAGAVPAGHLRMVVGYAVQIAWYRHVRGEVPDKITVAYRVWTDAARRIGASPVPALRDAPPPLTMTKTGRAAAVRALIATGRTDEEILAALRPTFPTLLPVTIRQARGRPLRKDVG